MRKRTKTQTTVETDRVLIIHKRRGKGRSWCGECGGQVPMVTPEEVAALAGVNVRMIYRWVEAKKVHFLELSADSLLICLNSVSSAAAESEGKRIRADGPS